MIDWVEFDRHVWWYVGLLDFMMKIVYGMQLAGLTERSYVAVRL